MTKFKPGDRVRIKPGSWGGVDNYYYAIQNYNGHLEFIVDDLTYHGCVKVKGFYCAAYPDRFELIPQEPEKDPHLPLTFILEMDRVLAQAAIKADTLNTYLDKPLSDFIRDVMEPNYLSLKFGA